MFAVTRPLLPLNYFLQQPAKSFHKMFFPGFANCHTLAEFFSRFSFWKFRWRTLTENWKVQNRVATVSYYITPVTFVTPATPVTFRAQKMKKSTLKKLLIFQETELSIPSLKGFYIFAKNIFLYFSRELYAIFTLIHRNQNQIERRFSYFFAIS